MQTPYPATDQKSSASATTYICIPALCLSLEDSKTRDGFIEYQRKKEKGLQKHPMQKAGSELRRLSGPTFTDRSTEEGLDVYLATRVLRCSCGFRVELPD